MAKAGKQTTFEWAAQDEASQANDVIRDLDPEAVATLTELMARAMIAVLAAVEGDDDER